MQASQVRFLRNMRSGKGRTLEGKKRMFNPTVETQALFREFAVVAATQIISSRIVQGNS